MKSASRRSFGCLAWVLISSVVLGTGSCSEPMEDSVVAAAPPKPRPRLVVVTPHNERIRASFGNAFSLWHEAQHGSAVEIKWESRGTPDCLTYLEDAAQNDELVVRRLVPDLFFGAGISDHQRLIDKGLARPLITPPIEALDLPETLVGLPLKDTQGYWHASALTGFGLYCHLEGLADRNIEAPTSWRDLAKPDYYGWLAMADPNHSGSHRFCMSVVLQRYGWREGWGLLIRMLGNARSLLPGSVMSTKSVSAGMCLVGMSVNFNALHDTAQLGGKKTGFVSPTDAPAVTPDLLTILNYASSPELAEKFVRFCLSEQGQSLWALPSGSGKPGANIVHFGCQALYRYPVVPSMYDRFQDQLSVQSNPFKLTSDFAISMEQDLWQSALLPPLVWATAGDHHVLLQRAWKAVIDAGTPSELMEELTAPLFDEATAKRLGSTLAANPAEAKRLEAEWAGKFKTKYEKILQLAGS